MNASSYTFQVQSIQVLFELRSLVPMVPEGYAAIWDVRVILPNSAVAFPFNLPTSDHPRQCHADEIVQKLLASLN